MKQSKNPEENEQSANVKEHTLHQGHISNETCSNSPHRKSPRKRSLSHDIQHSSRSNQDISKAKKSRKSKVISIPATKNSDDTEMLGKEFSSQNSLNVKFEVGHYVVLGNDVDDVEYCKIDSIDYHKQSAKYSMEVTYYKLLDGRLEVCLEPNGKKPWTGTKVPLNTVILNLRHSRFVDTEMREKLQAITREIYQ